MIHVFRISNFQSIRENVELDFRIPGTTPEMPCFRRSLSCPDTRLPAVVALIGPNGSGKTALLRAMTATARFAAYSYGSSPSGGIPEFVPFLSPGTRAAPTRVEVEFDASWLNADAGEGTSLLRYTLVLVRDGGLDLMPACVDYEALHAFPKGRPRRVFERCRDEPIYVSRELGIKPHDDRLSSIPANASVISTLARMGMEPFPAIAQDIGNMQTNIVATDPDPWRPDTEAIIRHYRENQSLMDEVSDKLQHFDLGIEGMQLHPLPDGKWLLVFEHEGLDAPVILGNESAGTRHLVHTFPLLQFVLDTGHPAVIDALDSDFHSELSAEILGWFRHETTNPSHAQLICSIHNLSVLDDLEKEEIFVVEKDQNGATQAHGARDVAGLRRDSNLQRQYRSGAIGGMPTFG